MENRRILRETMLVFLLTTGINAERSSYSGLTLKMDQALVTVHNLLPEGVKVFYNSDHCYKCLYQLLVSVEGGYHNGSVVVSTHYTLTLQVESNSTNSTFCRWSQLYEEAGHYSIWVELSDSPNNVTCSHRVDRSPRNANVPLVAAALLLACVTLLCVVAPYIYRRRCTTKLIKLICYRNSKFSEDSGESVDCGAVTTADQPKPTRLRSLDALRGVTLIAMVFLNYGGGGYWFFLHAPWNGLNIGDLVMPCFVFIIGTSVVLAFSAMRRKGVSRLQLVRKLTWRTVVLILIGFCFINYSPRDGPLSLSWLRIPGVLQRLGFTYFVLALMQTFWGHKQNTLRQDQWWSPVQDVVLYWPEWIFILLLETIWLCITFLMPVPNCPTGYLGAGGIGDYGLYPNCTGGAAGYIDRRLFGDNMYRWPSCRELYRTTQPFDPEGILGTINSIVMGFIGMQAGKIFLFYRRKNVSILSRFLLWAIILGISAAILSKCTRDEGFIPVNKNLWSLSFVMCAGSVSFLALGFMYFVIDAKGWWSGVPFTYPDVFTEHARMNSIFVYIGHTLLGFYFPFSWEMHYQDSHWENLFQAMWATSLWVLISYQLYRKRFFLKI